MPSLSPKIGISIPSANKTWQRQTSVEICRGCDPEIQRGHVPSRRCTGGVELTDVVDREDKSSATNLGRNRPRLEGWEKTMGYYGKSRYSEDMTTSAC